MSKRDRKKVPTQVPVIKGEAPRRRNGKAWKKKVKKVKKTGRTTGGRSPEAWERHFVARQTHEIKLQEEKRLMAAREAEAKANKQMAKASKK